MTIATPSLVRSAWRRLPPSIRRRLRGNTGKRFVRFVPVSIAAVVTSQVTLAMLVGVAHRTAGVSAVIASMTGALVSYLMSRWAWERKGRPHLLKETLPFWAVAVGSWLVLGVTSHYASVWAVEQGLSSWQRTLVVNTAYLMANCVTFVTRFTIFHYILFTDKTVSKARRATEDSGAPREPALITAEGDPALPPDNGTAVG